MMYFLFFLSVFVCLFSFLCLSSDVKDDRGSAFPGVKLRKRESVMVQGSLLLKPRSLQHQQQQQTSPGKTRNQTSKRKKLSRTHSLSLICCSW
jgi:Flp pilus assembly protein TadB